MDDHGDDYGNWFQEGRHGIQRSEEEWLTMARYVRHAALKVLGLEQIPLCLPGEPQECGRGAQQHVLAWAAQLKAAAQHLIEDAAPSPARAAHVAGPLYQRRLAELRHQNPPVHPMY